MNKYEEDLQRSIEQGVNPKGDEADIKIYQSLFKTLSQPPAVNIPDNFIDAVLAKVVERSASRDSREYVWLSVGVFMLSIACMVGFAVSGMKLKISNLKPIAGIAGLVLFAIAFCVVLNILDKKLVTRKLESSW